MSRFVVNKHKILSSNSINVAVMINDIDVFLMESFYILSNEVANYRGKRYNLYTGIVGTYMALRRIKQMFKNDLSELPDMCLQAGKKSDVCGICSDNIAQDMWECLSLGHPFEVPGHINFRDCREFELLYGVSGLAVEVDYFVKKGVTLRNPGLVGEIISAVDLSAFPWSWHDSVYFGCAHGTAGIMLTLLRLGNLVSDELMTRLLQLAALPSGNMKSSIHSTRDKLVQWCHGAPGFVALLLEYEAATTDPSLRAQYHDTAARALDCIWERGLLTKGGGICHGIAGNGYSFLAAFQKYRGTAQERSEHLYQATVFANEILALGPGQSCLGADAPYSLFEGLAGTVHFLMDVRQLLLMVQENATPEQIRDFSLFDGMCVF